jgi:hypothetical protein
MKELNFIPTIIEDGQIKIDYDKVDTLEQEKIEKNKIIKEFRIPESQHSNLNKKGKEWFMGEELVGDWYNRMREEERKDNLSYIPRREN